MDWTLILLIVLFIILIYMNYKKVIRNIYKNKNIESKKVRWNLKKAAKESTSLNHQKPSIDFFDESINPNGLAIENKLLNSDIIKYLNTQDDSYGSKLYSVNPVQAWISEDPDLLKDKNNYTAHEIINLENSNTRIDTFREDQLQGSSNDILSNASTIGEVYDNMVDNFRVKWGKFEGLGAFDQRSDYNLDVKPATNGYTDFATY